VLVESLFLAVLPLFDAFKAVQNVASAIVKAPNLVGDFALDV